MGEHSARHLATQTEHPWRTAIRASAFTFFGALGAAAAAAPILGPFVSTELPNTPYGAWIIGAGVTAGLLSGALSRIANQPAVASFLTQLGLGPVPKSRG